MDTAMKAYREKAMAFIQQQKKGFVLEKKTTAWAAWEAYFLTTIGKLPLEMTNALRGYTKAVTVPTEFPEAFDAEYVAGEIDERTERQRRRAAAKMCNCELGLAAHENGWLRALVEFAEKHGRLPIGREVDGVMAVGARAKAALRESEGMKFYAELLSLRQAMNESAYREVFRCEPPATQAAAE